MGKQPTSSTNTDGMKDEDDTSVTSKSEDFVESSSHLDMEDDEDDEEFFDANDELMEGEDVLGMALAEKTNALIRGKSTDFDRTFVPRSLDTVDLESGAGQEHSSVRRISSSSFPGAYRVRLQRESATTADSSSSQLSVVSEDESHDKTVVVPMASLVARQNTEETDPENPLATLPLKSMTPIAEVVESDDEGKLAQKAMRRKRIFRCAVILGVLLIAAVLIAILVEVTSESVNDRQPRPPKKGPPKNGNGKSYDGSNEFNP